MSDPTPTPAPRMYAGPAGNLDLEHIFSYHPPSDDQIPIYEEMRHQGLQLATFIAGVCPSSPERSLAITKLREAIMWANAAIACEKKVDHPLDR